MNAREAAEKIVATFYPWRDGPLHESHVTEAEQIIQAAIDVATSDLEAEVTRLREENERHKSYWLTEQKIRLESVDVIDLYSACKAKVQIEQLEQRTKRAELLVRLVAIRKLQLFAIGEFHIRAKVTWEAYPCTYTNGTPNLTDEQWERLAALEKGGV